MSPAPRISRTTLAKMDKQLYDEFRRIAAIRLANRKDKRYSPQTVQRKTLRHPLWKQMAIDLENYDFIDDKKGQSPLSLFRFMIISFLAVVFFGGLIFAVGLLNNAFEDIGEHNEINSGQIGYVNLTKAGQDTFGKFNQSIQGLRMVAITIIFSEIMLVFIFNAFTKTHPALFIMWILIVFLAVMFSAPISNAYESLLQQGIYDGILESFTGSNYFLLNLPTIVLMVGIIGGIFMFVNIIRGTGGAEQLSSLT